MIFLLVSFVMFLFFYVYSKDIFIGITGEKEPVKELPLENGVVIEQELPEKDTMLMGLSIRFKTYKNSSGNLHVQFYENDQMLEEWEIEASQLEDNIYHSFPLSNLRNMNPDSSYKISIKQTYKGKKGVSIWLTNEKEKDCYSNGKRLEEYSLCCQMTYVNKSLKIWVYVIAIFLFLVMGIVILWKINEKIIMSGFLVVMGAIYFWMCPLGMMPDETNHFLRAFEISCGQWTSQHMGEDGGGGNYLPAALPSYMDSDAEIDWEEITELRYGNTSLYAPVSYLPQAVGIRIARVFTNNVSKIFYAGRFGNFLISILLCLWAIHIMPFGKRILFLIMMFPMSQQEMVSMAPDGFTIALSIAFLAYIFQLCCSEKKLIKKDFILISFMGCVLALCKIVYVVLLFVIFLLPQDKFSNKKQARVFQFGLLIIAFIMNLVWLKISAGYLIEFMPGVSSGEQVKYILTHLPNYLMVIIQTVLTKGASWGMSMIGNPLGALNINISPIVWITIFIMFVYEICNCRHISWKVHKMDTLILLFIFLSGAVLICTSIYVQWTAVASPIVSGVQGRYFIPLLPYLAMSAVFAFYIQKQQIDTNEVYQLQNGSYFYMLLLMLHGITVLDVIHYYI